VKWQKKFYKNGRVYNYPSVQFTSKGETINIFGLSEATLERLDKMAKKIDANLTVTEYCKNVLRNYAFEKLKDCDGCTLKQKLEMLKPKFDPSLTVSGFAKMIILDHLKSIVD
jgi:hypothetical protein